MFKNKISLVSPLYNESGNVKEFIKRSHFILSSLIDYDFEIILVNDGSIDDTECIIEEEIKKYSNKILLFSFNKNLGQTLALNKGIELSSGGIIVLIDSDLENHPEDIPFFIKKIEQGYDVVIGWRKKRWSNQFISRKIPSIIANYIISKVIKFKVRDNGCTLKAFKSEILKKINLSRDMHRLIVPYALFYSKKIIEIEVNYSPRSFGKSNYGLSRVLKFIPDFFYLCFLDKNYRKNLFYFFLNLIFFLLIIIIIIYKSIKILLF